MKIIRAILLWAVAFAPAVALAEGAGEGEGGKGPCRQDVQRYCAQAAGGEKTMDCLLDHKKEITDACYDALKTRLSSNQGNGGSQQGGGQGPQRGGQATCHSDVAQFCRGMEPGGGRIVDCLISHQKDISEACYQALKKKASNEQGDADAGFQSVSRASPASVYRSKQPDGRIVYSDARPMASMLQGTVPLDRVIIAQPPR